MLTPDHIHPAVLRTFAHPSHDFINHPDQSTACAVCGGVSHPFGVGGFDPGPAPSADDLIAAQETLEAYDGREEDIPAPGDFCSHAGTADGANVACPECGRLVWFDEGEDAPGLTILGMPIGDREDSFGSLLGDDAVMPCEDDTIECPDCGLGPRACACDEEADRA